MQLEVNVEKQFNDFQCSFSFSLSNEKCGVFGPSGSGKSTLMNMLSGIMAPDNGKITLNNTVLLTVSDVSTCHLINAGLASSFNMLSSSPT